MNIVISAGIFPPDIGGPANFVPRIAHWLTQRGHRVQVVCWSDREAPLAEDCAHADFQYSFEVHRILRQQSPITRFFQTVSCLYRLGKSADIFFANTLDLEVRVAATLARKPEVHKVVGDRAWEVARRRGWFTGTIDAYQQTKGKNLKSWRIPALNALRNFALARSHRIITPSQYLAEMVVNWSSQPSDKSNKPKPASRVDVIYNSTQLAPTAEPVEIPAYPGKTITTICRLVPWKGVDSLVEALAQMPNIRLLIVGDGPDRMALEQQVNQQALDNRVHFLGQISKPQVRSVLDASDIFVLNSTYEGLPHVVLEAMAAKVPVVATNVGGTGEVVKNNQTGLLIPVRDTAALVAALTQLVRSPKLGEQLTANAQTLIKTQFSEKLCFMDYEKVLTLASTQPRERSAAVQISAVK